ncbi:MAG: PDDEXK nuclease domain-containing protein [Candidatus Margulisbacteria bacterium]|jgi:predicted nuclease of restriction endonuclease-like (RecB) superfamily|nr:PDDEXK nuclease domain-containing protein [Candidatus Margulisiibacteriota bacterium]
MTKIIKPDLYARVADLLSKARQAVARNVNQAMVYTYYEIGRMIVEDEQQGRQRAEYGKGVLKELSSKLIKKFGKGFSVENLDRMRFFYKTYAQQISSTPLTKLSAAKSARTIRALSAPQQLASLPALNFSLSWSHYLMLMRIDNVDERRFYEIESNNNNWSLRELQRQFDSSLYERLVLSSNKKKVRKLANKGEIVEQPQDLIKEPYVLEFLGLPEQSSYSESELEQKIIDKLQHFLLELGKGFAFIGRQVRFTFDEKHFRVDLVFYNRLLKCFVLIDLKIGSLTHQDLGQMQMYTNYYDRFVKLPEENKTIGIILCRAKNKALVEITLPEDNKTIFAGKYQTILPSKTDLQKLIESKN